MSNGERYEVVMPKLGLIMTEARLSEWHVEEGEQVKAGEPLFSLESDKSIIDIEAPTGGRVSIVVPAGETVPVMTPVAYILAQGATMPVTLDKPVIPAEEVVQAKKVAQTMAPGQDNASSIIRATPKARKVAREQGIILKNIKGSGPRGMIIVDDLKQIVESDPLKATPIARKMAADCGLDLSEVRGTGPEGRITRADVSQALAKIVAGSPGPSKGKAVPGQEPLPLTGLRGVIAQRLSESWRERPQVTLNTEVDATNLVSARQQLIDERGQKVSFNAFILMATARVLREQRQVNVTLTENGIRPLQDINIGIAVDSDRGLLVPVLRQADKKSILALDSEITELSEKALSGKALPDELSGGTFTITNLGAFGIDAFTPIINPPEAAVLGIGRIAPRPYVVGRQLEVRDTVTLSLSFDHRLLDGAPAARFLQRLSTLIENPIALTSIDYGTK